MTVFREWPSSDDGLVDLYPRESVPVLRANFIASADGAASVGGLSGGLHGPGDKEIFDTLRMLCDALIVGAGTVKAEKYDALRLTAAARAWRRDHGLSEFPLMVVVSRALTLDLDQLIFTDAPIPPIVVTTKSAPSSLPPRRADLLQRRAEVLAVGDDEVDLAAMVAALHERGATQLLSEGGPRLFNSMIAADLITELCLTVSPLLVGGGPGRIAAGPPAIARSMSLRHALSLRDMLFLRYARTTG
ncbi:pyrimidine reductase family protein [Actinoplanes sp. NPDC051411]|uniref:pyrimidine reductase family protein n=1 Tax=Actinoplanes sp. NPDC051411 TaxID=3155522 RepID=UPI00342C704A